MEPVVTSARGTSNGEDRLRPALAVLRDRPVRELARPFSLIETWVWEDDDRSEEELDPLLDPVYDHGSLVLVTEGGAMYWHLVVTGPHRGHIWNITGEGASPFGAEFGYTTARSGFAGWVQHWAEGNEWYDAA